MSQDVIELGAAQGAELSDHANELRAAQSAAAVLGMRREGNVHASGDWQLDVNDSAVLALPPAHF